MDPDRIHRTQNYLRERIEGNVENRNCYCIQIDYDDDNEEDEEEGELKVQGTWRQLSNMALTSLGYNEIWSESNNTLGLIMHTVIQFQYKELKADIKNGSYITGVQWDLT